MKASPAAPSVITAPSTVNQNAKTKPTKMNIIEKFWCSLGGNTAQLFGKESASSMVWMLISLSTRFLLQLFRIDSFVPFGLIFAFPYILQVYIFL